MESKTTMLDDGRTLSWAELGSESAATVLIHQHGAGSSRLEMALYDERFAELELRVIAPERPGYGYSTAARRGRSVFDASTDVAQLVAHLGIDEFAVSGFSGGGPHALAIAAALGTSVTRVLLRAALAPNQDPRNARDVEIRQRAGRVPWPEFENWYERRGGDGLTLAAADEEAFADPFYMEAAMATLTDGSRQGPLGDAGDQWALATPWGFELGAIVQPVDLWHGDADTVVPVSHARALSSALPNATLRILPGDGHFSIGRRVAEQVALIASAR